MTTAPLYVAKLLDPAGRFVCSEAFTKELDAENRAWIWSYSGPTTYVMNGSIRTIYKAGIKQKLTPQIQNYEHNTST